MILDFKVFIWQTSAYLSSTSLAHEAHLSSGSCSILTCRWRPWQDWPPASTAGCTGWATGRSPGWGRTASTCWQWAATPTPPTWGTRPATPPTPRTGASPSGPWAGRTAGSTSARSPPHPSYPRTSGSQSASPSPTSSASPGFTSLSGAPSTSPASSTTPLSFLTRWERGDSEETDYKNSSIICMMFSASHFQHNIEIYRNQW